MYLIFHLISVVTFFIDDYHDYYLQGWTRDESKTVMDKLYLIRIWYGQMRIFLVISSMAVDSITPDLMITSACNY